MMLTISNLCSGYSMIEVVHEVNLALAAGQRMALVGPNGAGKTTLLETIVGFVDKRAGDVLLDGRSISGLKPEERAKLGIALVTERRNLFPDLTAAENLRLGRCAVAGGDRWARASVERATERVFTLFPKLKSIQDRPVRVMSGGEQQMVAVGRALMAEPKVLLLDEPSQGLAPKLVEAMYDAIQTIASDMTVLLVEQDMDLARFITSDIYLMLDGRVRQLSAEELADDNLLTKEIFGEPSSGLVG